MAEMLNPAVQIDGSCKPAHSPGPWTNRGVVGLVCDEIQDADGHGVARVWTRRLRGRNDPGEPPTDPDPQGEANARLIIASTKLLIACKALQMEARARGCGLRIADEAIAEAEGHSEGGDSEAARIARFQATLDEEIDP